MLIGMGLNFFDIQTDKSFSKHMKICEGKVENSYLFLMYKFFAACKKQSLVELKDTLVWENMVYILVVALKKVFSN